MLGFVKVILGKINTDQHLGLVRGKGQGDALEAASYLRGFAIGGTFFLTGTFEGFMIPPFFFLKLLFMAASYFLPICLGTLLELDIADEVHA